MKTLAALVLLAAIASTASAVPRFLRARQQHHGVVVRGNPLGVDDQCPPNNEYWHAVPHPQDCGKFFICNWGVGVLQECPGDLQFNPTLMVCDWPNNAGCTAGEEPPVEETAKPTEPASTAKPTTAAPESEETEEPVEPTTQAPESEEETEAPESEEDTEAPVDEETEAPVDEETEAPVDEETTQPAENEEPTTQADDESDEETTEPEEEVPVTEDPEEEEPAGPICPADGLHVVENPADCETFYLCNAGTAILVTCPEEQAFDRNFSTCTEAAAAGCSA